MKTIPTACRKRVLVVDDHGDSRRFTVAALRQSGCSVKQAESVATALRCLQTWDPDAVISDWNLGDGNGSDVLNAASPAGERHPRRVLISGTALDDLSARARDCVFDTFLRKPATVNELRQAVCPGMDSGGPDAAETRWHDALSVSRLERQLTKIDRDIVAANLKNAAGRAHRLAASCAMAGFDRFAQELLKLERSCSERPTPRLVAGAWARVRSAAVKLSRPERLPGSPTASRQPPLRDRP